MKKTLVLFLFLASGCIPQDFMSRAAHSLEALRSAYSAVCEDRDEEPECVEARKAFNAAQSAYTLINEELPE